jgi:hypothetical protein
MGLLEFLGFRREPRAGINIDITRNDAINSMVSRLSARDQDIFTKQLKDVFNDPDWLADIGVDYAKAEDHMPLIKEKLYEELYITGAIKPPNWQPSKYSEKIDEGGCGHH